MTLGIRLIETLEHVMHSRKGASYSGSRSCSYSGPDRRCASQEGDEPPDLRVSLASAATER
jgi:hypothetical protein